MAFIAKVLIGGWISGCVYNVLENIMPAYEHLVSTMEDDAPHVTFCSHMPVRTSICNEVLARDSQFIAVRYAQELFARVRILPRAFSIVPSWIHEFILLFYLLLGTMWILSKFHPAEREMRRFKKTLARPSQSKKDPS